MALAQQDVPDRQQLVERDAVQVAAHVGPAVVLDHHEQAVAKLQAPVRLGQARARRRRVEAHVPRDGARLVHAAPAEQARAPREVDVRRPQLELLVEHLAADGAGLEHRAAIEHARAVAAEDLGRGGIAPMRARRGRRACSCGGGRRPCPRRRGRRGGRRAACRSRARAAARPTHAALVQAGARGLEEALAEHAVGVEQQHRVALRREDPGVDRRRVGHALAQPQHARAVPLGDRARGVRARVVDDDDVRARLRDGGRQAVLEQRRLVDAQDEDRRAIQVHSISS